MSVESGANVEQAVLDALAKLGLNDTVVESKKLEQFYEIGRMPDEIQEKQVHRVDFSPKGDRITIIPIHDIHYGSVNSNKDKFRAYVDYILRTPDTYTIGLGDLIENATKTSVGLGVYEQEVHIDEQIEHMAEWLEPLAKEGKLLGLMPGNHEYRTAVLTKLDPMRMVARELTKATGVHVPFLGYQGYHKWVIGDQVYKAMTFHGRSSAGTPGGRINSVRKMANVAAEMDMYFMGHVHSIQDDTDVYYYIDDEDDRLKFKKRHYIIGGSLLTYFGGYAEMMALAPSPQGLVKVDLMKDRHQVIVHKP